MITDKHIDKITLADAVTTPVWLMVWAGEPSRMIDVRMTYNDLKIICDAIKDVANEMKKENME